MAAVPSVAVGPAGDALNDTHPLASPLPPSHHDSAGLIAGFITIALLTLVIGAWVTYRFMFPLWKKPYRTVDQADLNAYGKWNEDLARGLQKRRERRDDVVGSAVEDTVLHVHAREGTDVEQGVVQNPVNEVVPGSWQDETWWQAWSSGFMFRPWS
ncbi:hypothetical protein OHC33_000512 [Knufia fluminis]|uniref:Uncharacterized protein n=1 Tax=Knufia fluminis TaxID=191047 RepID=A0AAN8I9C3_9EURO|nr:hypothetical protein OHC33_000512 [Knufia fluminis]